MIVGVPVLRLKGDYLAIVTLAFGEIIKNIINVLYIGLDSTGLHFSLLEQRFELAEGGEMIINGPMGVSGVSRLSTFTTGFVLVLITLFLILNLINSRAGRAIMSVRDNKIAADSIGISTTRYKLMAFVISAAFAGMAGTLYGMNYTTITAAKFDFNTSILILVFSYRRAGQYLRFDHRRVAADDPARVLREVRRIPHADLCGPADRDDAVQQLAAESAAAGKARHEADEQAGKEREGGRVIWQCLK